MLYPRSRLPMILKLRLPSAQLIGLKRTFPSKVTQRVCAAPATTLLTGIPAKPRTTRGVLRSTTSSPRPSCPRRPEPHDSRRPYSLVRKFVRGRNKAKQKCGTGRCEIDGLLPDNVPGVLFARSSLTANRTGYLVRPGSTYVHWNYPTVRHGKQNKGYLHFGLCLLHEAAAALPETLEQC